MAVKKQAKKTDKNTEMTKKPRPVKLKELALWVEQCDERLEKRMEEIAADVCADGNIKVLRLIGPTCAGKTTAATMLKKRFRDLGKHLHLVSIDDFYFNTARLRKMSAEKGMDSIDYDSPDTIDVEALDSFVTEIFTEDRSHCPVFDFSVGERTGYKEFRCGEEDIFLFEGIQVLYPAVSAIFEKTGHTTVEIYIAPQSAIEIGGGVFEPNEIRLMRRIVRDRKFRGTEADFTLKLWQSVRENEERNIFPFVKGCKYSIDSTMPYEIGILKPYLKQALENMPENNEFQEIKAQMLQKIRGVLTLPDSLIPEGSIYKEFV